MAPILSVAVIGAGAAGLCAGKHLKAEPERFVFDIFEQQDEVGGTWYYSDKVGKDEFGLPIHSSMYKNLKANLPKEVMAFPDFPFPFCDGISFLHHSQILQYLRDYAHHYDLYKHIKFHKYIENVKPLNDSNEHAKWSVSYSDVVTKEKETKIYDVIMVCNGHYSVPYIPEIPGLGDFKGLIMHSHDYRDATSFKDQKVVVLGAGPSGDDIALEISKIAKEVILSHNKTPHHCPLPENLKQEKGIENFDDHSVTFIGGKTYECDAVIFCTGYLYQYTFFNESCNVEICDQKVSPLYLHTFHIDFPSLAIFAVPKQIIPFPIYDQQAKVFLKILKGVIHLPSPEEMRAEEERDFNRRLEMGFEPRHAHVMPVDLQWEFDDALSKLGEIEPIPQAVRKLFAHVIQSKQKDLVNYRDVNYRLVDGETFIQCQ